MHPKGCSWKKESHTTVWELKTPNERAQYVTTLTLLWGSPTHKVRGTQSSVEAQALGLVIADRIRTGIVHPLRFKLGIARGAVSVLMNLVLANIRMLAAPLLIHLGRAMVNANVITHFIRAIRH